MKKPNWQPDKISLTLLVLLSFGAAIGCIMIISKNVRTIGAIVLPVCIAGIVATIVIGQKIFYKKIKKGSSVKQIKSPLQNKFDIWLDSVLKDFNMNAVAFNFNIYDNGDNNFSVELIATKTFDDNNEDWAADEIFASRKNNSEFHFRADTWQQSINDIIKIADNYLNNGKFASKLTMSEAVACGFVEGSLKMIYRNLENWLTKFKPFKKIAKALNPAENNCFSKFGGLPLVPKNFKWPRSNEGPLQFLMQLKFSEINPSGDLKNFPSKGLLYIFVSEEAVNTGWSVDGYKKGEHFDIIFYKEEESVIQSENPNTVLFGGFNVSPSTITTYPDTEDCKEAEELVYNRPLGGMDDAYEFDFRYETKSEYQIGGWPFWIQSSELDSDDGWVLLMQIGSDDENGRMWGDDGDLYFVIKEKDLIDQDFSKVKLIMQCT